MPPKGKKKPAVEATAAAAVAKAPASTPVTTTAEAGGPSSEVASLLTRGVRLTAPRSHKDALMPLLEHVASLPPRRPPPLVVGAKGIGRRECPHGPGRAEELAALVLPRTFLISLDATVIERSADDGGDNNDISTRNGVGATSRKRTRTSPEAAHAGSTDNGSGSGGADGTALARLTDLLSDLDTATCGRIGPFAGDSDYLRAADGGYAMGNWCATATALNFSQAFLAVVAESGFCLVTHVAPSIKAVTAVYAAHCQQRLARMAVVPRVIRVGQRLGMSEREVATLTFLLVRHSGCAFSVSSPTQLTLDLLAFYGGLLPRESMEFVGAHRLHIKQGLVTSDGQNRSNFTECRYAMPQEAVAALTGVNLTDEQLIKLEHTALAEVLTEEREAVRKQQQQQQQQTIAVTSAAAVAAITAAGSEVDENDDTADDYTGANTTRSQSASRGEEGEEDDNGEVNGCADEGGAVFDASTVMDVLGQLGVDTASLPGGHTVAGLQSMVQREVNAKARGSGAKVEGETVPSPPAADTTPGSVTATTTTEGIMHRPYTTDFEYMEEAFKIIASLIRLRAAEGDMKDEDDNYTPKTKIEAAMRELKGKVRVSSAIHASRVAATVAHAERVGLGDKAAKEAAAAATPSGGGSNHSPPNDRAGGHGDTENGKTATSTPATTTESVLGDASSDADSKVFLPRIEQLTRRLSLSPLEQQVMLLMVGAVISHDILVAINGRYVMRDGQQRYLTVGYILFVLCDALQDRIAARRLFYQTAPLIANGILSLSFESAGRSRFNTDLMDYVIDVDRKIVDHLMGSETQTGEMVPGSSLSQPTVPMDNVVLPPQTTQLVLSTIAHYGMFERTKKRCGFGNGLGSTASGLAMLFHGPSGTGKTMLANAVAHELKKRLLLVNVSQFKAERQAPEMMRFIFREAKLNDAIIFFDECEALFESREVNPLVTSVLTEFEKNDGLIIMATNKAQVMDEAMNRRISLMVEFKLPSHPMREQIWQRHMPAAIPLAADVSLQRLALNYELSGGLIRNAVLAALNAAVARENSETPTLHMADLEKGAKLQLRGFFLAAGKSSSSGSGSGGGGSRGGANGGHSETYVTPRRTLAELIVDPAVKARVGLIARIAKSRATLFSQWGFSEEACQDQGGVHLLSGPSGTGKSLAVEGIAYECGATIRLCNVGELLLLRELNIAAVFEEARQLGAIVVFDEAQELFSHSERAVNITQLIQYYAVRYPKPVIVIATTAGSGGGGGALPDSIDVRSTRFTLTEHIVFKYPDRALRRELWRGAFPEKVPLATDVDFDRLSERNVSAKLVRKVAFTVCCRAAAAAVVAISAAADATTTTTTEEESSRKKARPEVAEASVGMKDIEAELTRCILAEEQRNPARAMFV